MVSAFMLKCHELVHGLLKYAHSQLNYSVNCCRLKTQATIIKIQVCNKILVIYSQVVIKFGMEHNYQKGIANIILILDIDLNVILYKIVTCCHSVVKQSNKAGIWYSN